MPKVWRPEDDEPINPRPFVIMTPDGAARTGGGTPIGWKKSQEVPGDAVYMPNPREEAKVVLPKEEAKEENKDADSESAETENPATGD